MKPVAKSTLILLLACVYWTSFSQVRFCAVGDILLDREVRKVIEDKGIFYPFEGTRRLISQNDIAFFNLECPVANPDEGYAINKRYSFRADPDYINGLAYAGFNVASVANNHTIDYGKPGLLNTMKHLQSASILPVGAGSDQEEAFEPVLIEKNGETFAIFAILDFLLEGTVFNELSVYPAYGQKERLCKLITKYNSVVDNIIISFHWGNENQALPSEKQVELAHAVVDAGADLVLGHHPHVLQSIENYRGKLILYSLGNFVFDNSKNEQKQSAVFQCQFHNGQIMVPELIPVLINNCRPVPAEEKTSEEIIKRLNRLSNPFDVKISKKNAAYKINYSAEKPLKELMSDGVHFNIFQNKIDSYYDHKITTFSMQDSSFVFSDAVLNTEKDTAFIYAIIKDTLLNISRLAIFPYAILKNEYLRPSIDSHTGLFPWKLQIMDVDEDQRPELVVGVKKKTRYHNIEENRIFVYNISKDYIYPKWLGSKVGNPIVDFKVDGISNRLIILERFKNSADQMIISYKWNGFGFKNDAIIQQLDSAANIKFRFHLSDYSFNAL
ncbi:CapA family protein [Saccharicrinis sp. FJH54]|uniref:CapA family protein n=1 Tax=Saccharicrinis sp. FJH54 TaxID=3344665 RepID=UPI0035D3E4C3